MILLICVQLFPLSWRAIYSCFSFWRTGPALGRSIPPWEQSSHCPQLGAGPPGHGWLSLQEPTMPLYGVATCLGAGSTGHPDLSLAPGLGPARACGVIWHSPSGHFGYIPPPKETPQCDGVSHCPAVPRTEHRGGWISSAKPRKVLGKWTRWPLYRW